MMPMPIDFGTIIKRKNSCFQKNRLNAKDKTNILESFCENRLFSVAPFFAF